MKSCTQTSKDVKLILQEYEDKKLTAKKSMSGEVHEDDDKVSRLLDISRIQSGKRSAEKGSMSAAKKNTKDPLDVIYYRKPEETLKKGKQTSLNDAKLLPIHSSFFLSEWNCFQCCKFNFFEIDG